MNIESIKSLFIMFSDEEDSEKYMPLITLSIAETEKMLRPEADPSDVRLDFLCAAMSNRRLQQIYASRERKETTFAGKFLNTSQNTSLMYAEKLLQSYIQLCNDLITEENFVFRSI